MRTKLEVVMYWGVSLCCLFRSLKKNIYIYNIKVNISRPLHQFFITLCLQFDELITEVCVSYVNNVSLPHNLQKVLNAELNFPIFVLIARVVLFMFKVWCCLSQCSQLQQVQEVQIFEPLRPLTICSLRIKAKLKLLQILTPSSTWWVQS